MLKGQWLIILNLNNGENQPKSCHFPLITTSYIFHFFTQRKICTAAHFSIKKKNYKLLRIVFIVNVMNNTCGYLEIECMHLTCHTNVQKLHILHLQIVYLLFPSPVKGQHKGIQRHLVNFSQISWPSMNFNANYL